MLSNQQSIILSTIEGLIDENRRLDANTTQKLDEIRLQLLEQTNKDNIDDFSGLLENLRALAEEGKSVKKQQNILRSLHFPNIKARHETIKLAHAETFKWIF